MARELHSIEKDFETKLAALEKEVLKESAQKVANSLFLQSLEPKNIQKKQIPLILRKPSVQSSQPVQLLPKVNTPGRKIYTTPVFQGKTVTHGHQPIQLIPVNPEKDGVKYLIPDGGNASEPIKLLVPHHPNSKIKTAVSSSLPVVAPPIKVVVSNAGIQPNLPKPIKIIVKGTNSMRVFDPKLTKAITAVASGLPITSLSSSNTSNISTCTGVGGNSSMNLITLQAKSKIVKVPGNVKALRNPIEEKMGMLSTVPTTKIINTSLHKTTVDSSKMIKIDNRFIQLSNSNPKSPPVVISPSSIQKSRMVKVVKGPSFDGKNPLTTKELWNIHNQIIPDKSLQVSSEAIDNDFLEELNSLKLNLKDVLSSASYSRKDMLKKLHFIQQFIFDSILSKYKITSLEPKVYLDLFKEHYFVMKKLLAVRKLIRKYEGSSVPYPVHIQATESSKDAMYEEELRKEMKIFGIDEIANLFHLNDANHDFLTVILNGMESKNGNQFCCRTCFSKFAIFSKYIRHLINKHPVLLRCIYCGDVFISALELKEHIKSFQHGYCEKCDIFFTKYKDYFDHQNVIHGSSKSSVQTVNTVAKKDDTDKHKRDIYLHLCKYHPNNNCFVCSTSACKLSFDSINKLYEHFIDNHVAIWCRFCSKDPGENDTIFCSDLEFFAHCKLKRHVFCPVCDVLFKNEYMMRCHLTGIHSLSPKNSAVKTLMETYPKIFDHIRCQACGYTSIHASEVKRHIQHISQMSLPPNAQSDLLIIQHKKLICSYCNEVFYDRQDCVSHLSSKHSPKITSSKLIPLESEIHYSNEIFIKGENIIEHAVSRVDHESKKVVYSIKKSDFIKKIMNPLRENSPDKARRCLTCRIACASAEELEIHADEFHKEIHCDKCDFVAKGKKMYQDHFDTNHFHEETLIKLALPISPIPKESYICTVCHDRPIFSDKDEFTSHILQNSSLHDSYICQICVTAFLSTEERNEHAKMKHSDKICPLCDNSDSVQIFIFKSLLHNHLGEHHKDLVCIQCPGKPIFESSRQLTVHVGNFHNKIVKKVKSNNRIEAYLCPEKSCQNNPIKGSMFISQINHDVLRHNKCLDIDESQNDEPFIPSRCGFCPEGLKYYTFTKLFTHVKERHSSIVACYNCVDIPVFSVKENLFHHSRLFDHYGCFCCPLGNWNSKLAWREVQFHMKKNHRFYFCWNCEKLCRSLEGHRSICSVCDAVHCLPLTNSDHKCSEEDLKLRQKLFSNDGFLKSRKKSIDRYFSESSNKMPTTKLKLLLQHIFRNQFEASFWFDANLEKSDYVTLEEAIEVLHEATNSPKPNEYLLKLWRDFSSMCKSKFFDPKIKIKVEIDVDEKSEPIVEAVNSASVMETDVFIKEEIHDEIVDIQSNDHSQSIEFDKSSCIQKSESTLNKEVDEEPPSQPNSPENDLNSFFDKELDVIEPSIPLCLEDILKEEECDDYTKSKPGPKCSKKRKKKEEELPSLNDSKVDDSALLEDIDDILETTHKPTTPIKSNKVDKDKNKSPTVSTRQTKRIHYVRLVDAEAMVVDKDAQKKSVSLRSSTRRSDTSKNVSYKEGLKRKSSTNERVLRKRTRTS